MGTAQNFPSLAAGRRLTGGPQQRVLGVRSTTGPLLLVDVLSEVTRRITLPWMKGLTVALQGKDVEELAGSDSLRPAQKPSSGSAKAVAWASSSNRGEPPPPFPAQGPSPVPAAHHSMLLASAGAAPHPPCIPHPATAVCVPTEGHSQGLL